MSTRILVSLPDETYERAETYAALAERDVSEVIAAALATSLPSLEVIEGLRAISKLPDDIIVSLTQSRMNNEIALAVRQNWVRAGWHPPGD